MAVIESNNFSIELSADAGATWKDLVCEENSSASYETSTNSRLTKCGTFAVGSEQSASYDFTGVVKSDPSVTELSYKALQTYWKDKTALVIRRETPSGGASVYEKAEVFISALGNESNAGDLVSFTGTFTVSDTSTIDFTP